MNTTNFYIAQKYAISYFMSKGENIEDKKKNFDEVIDKINKNLFYLSNPSISLDVKKQVIEKILGPYKNKQIASLLFIMIKNKRINLIKEVYKRFNAMYFDWKNMIEVDVISRHELTDKDKEIISSIFLKLTSKKPYIKVWKDDSIIGGFIIKWDDKIIDATINKKINLIVENTLKGDGL